MKTTIQQLVRLIKEAINDIFSFEQLKSIKSFRGKYNYCIQNLGKPVGRGSGRVCFQLTDDKILKLALNQKGIAQNEVEGRTDYFLDGLDIKPEIFDETDFDNYTFIVCEYVLPAKPQDFKQYLGISWNEFMAFISRGASQYVRGHVYSSMSDEQYWELCENNETLYNINEYLGNYQPPFGDLKRISSYGISKDKGIVILDTGLDDYVYDNYYNKQALREQRYYVNNDISLAKAGRTAPKMSDEEFFDKVKNFFYKIVLNDKKNDDNYRTEKFIEKIKKGNKFKENDIENIIYSYHYKFNNKRYKKDLPKPLQILNDDLTTVIWDAENCDKIGGLKHTKSGIPFMMFSAGGDWECPLCFMLYWDGSKLRGYIPKHGNAFNKDTNQCFGNNDEADKAFLKKELKKQYSKLSNEQLEEKVNDAVNNIGYNEEECIKDFESRIKIK